MIERAEQSRSKVLAQWFTPGRILLLLMLLALVVRVIAVLSRPMLEFDEATYVRMAENLAAGKGPVELTGQSTTLFTPLLPLLAVALKPIFRDIVLSSYAVVVVFGVLLLLPMYLLGKELAGSRVGLMAAALVAFLPFFMDYTTKVYPEGLFIFFMLMGIFFARHLLRGCRIPCSILAGTSFGLALLAHAAAIFYVAVVVVLAVLTAIRKGVWQQMARALGLFLLFFLLFALPYVLYLHDQTGIWTFSGKTSSFAINQYSSAHGLRYGTLAWEQDLMMLTPDGSQLKLEAITATENPVATLLKDPAQSVKTLLKQSYVFYSSELSKTIPLWLLPLIGLGLFRRGWNRKLATDNAYLLIMMLPVLIILSMYALSRFVMPFLVLILIWVAEGWYELEDWAGETVSISLHGAWRERVRKFTPWIVGAAVILPLFASSVSTVSGGTYFVEQKQAGEWLKSEVGEGKRIMSRDTSSVYYSGGEAVLLPYADYGEFTDYARRQNVDYLIVDRWFIEERRPELVMILGDACEHPEWEKIHTVGEGTDSEVEVFRLNPADKPAPGC